MFVVDTNVLIYAADEFAAEHQRCRELLEKWQRQRGAWYITWGISYEFLRVVTHPRVLRKPWTATAARGFLEALEASPGLSMLVPAERHSRVVSEVIAEVPGLAGNIWHDVETAVLMREHGIRRICTRDTAFHRFRFLEVVDPLVDDL